jgi:hypothetical protein
MPKMLWSSPGFLIFNHHLSCMSTQGRSLPSPQLGSPFVLFIRPSLKPYHDFHGAFIFFLEGSRRGGKTSVVHEAPRIPSGYHSKFEACLHAMLQKAASPSDLSNPYGPQQLTLRHVPKLKNCDFGRLFYCLFSTGLR